MTAWEQAMSAMREDEAMRNGGESAGIADLRHDRETAADQRADEEFSQTPLFAECVRGMTAAAAAL